MRLFITAPFDDDGIEEIETIEGPTGNYFRYVSGGGFVTTVRGFYHEGETWHRTRVAAVAKAKEFRQRRIADKLGELQKLTSLDEIQ